MTTIPERITIPKPAVTEQTLDLAVNYAAINGRSGDIIALTFTLDAAKFAAAEYDRHIGTRVIRLQDGKEMDLDGTAE